MLTVYSLPVTISSYRCMLVCVGVFVSICITQLLFALACTCIWGNAFWRHNQSSTANLTQLMKRKWASSWWAKVTMNTANKAHKPTHLHTSSPSSQLPFSVVTYSRVKVEQGSHQEKNTWGRNPKIKKVIRSTNIFVKYFQVEVSTEAVLFLKCLRPILLNRKETPQKNLWLFSAS